MVLIFFKEPPPRLAHSKSSENRSEANHFSCWKFSKLKYLMSLSPTKASWIFTQEAAFSNVVLSSKRFLLRGFVLNIFSFSFREEPETVTGGVTLRSLLNVSQWTVSYCSKLAAACLGLLNKSPVIKVTNRARRHWCRSLLKAKEPQCVSRSDLHFHFPSACPHV